MKRYLSLVILSFICFVLQSTLLPHVKLANIMPNLLIVITSVGGFMYGRKAGMFAGVLCGILLDFMYSNVIGILIFIYALIGYLNGIVNKLYFKEDYVIPLIAIALSDLLYGILYYICNFLLRGRLDMGYYLFHIMIPEAIYTVCVGFFLYRLMRWIDGKINPEKEVPLEKQQNGAGH